MCGLGVVECFIYIFGIQIVVFCDFIFECVVGVQKILIKVNLLEVVFYFGSEDVWKKFCECKDIDFVYIVIDWKYYVQMVIYVMEYGKYVVIEVFLVMMLDEIWVLINILEKICKYCMQFENCVYDFFELIILNMV